MLATSARLLRLLSVLQARRFWTGQELAERLEVEPRTLRRDVDRLRSLGYTVVARNWRLPSGDGEADLIAWDRDELVIVEVKTRETLEYGLPDRAIGPEKIRSLGRVARAWAKSTGTGRVRADVVTVVLSPHISLNLHKDAVDFGKRLLPGAIPTSAIL